MERNQLAELLQVHLKPDDGRAAATGVLPPGLQQLGGDWLVGTADPAAFRRAFAFACAAVTGRVVLCDPSWGHQERTQLAALLGRSRAAGELGWLCIPTGGSSGELKLARHDGRTVAAAVAAYRSFFNVERVEALGLLPLYHVSGFMAWMRCLLSGGSMLDVAWREVEEGRRPSEVDGRVLSLVPTQLQRLLKDPAAADWLRRFSVVFLGGAPAWPSLLDNARTAGLRLCLSYGMTETAAMVVALPPDEFLAGASGAGRPLPHARISIDEAGVVRVEASSLFYGYAGAPDRGGAFPTEDLGHLEADGVLRIEGRRDAMIITGGKKVAPAEVEAAIRAGGHIDEVAVTGLPDAEWGQAVAACVPGSVGKEAITRAIEALEAELAPHKRPKRWIQVAEWPRDEKGKINRALLRAQLRPFLGPVACCSAQGSGPLPKA